MTLGQGDTNSSIVLGGTNDTLTIGASGNTGASALDMQARISGFSAGDTIILEGLGDTSGSFVSGTGLELGGTTGTTLDLIGSFVTGDFTVTTDGSNTTIVTDRVSCFCARTNIRTPLGNVAVERLQIGDLVTTTHGAAPVRWIGKRAYDGTFIAGNHQALPIKIRRHALASTCRRVTSTCPRITPSARAAYSSCCRG